MRPRDFLGAAGAMAAFALASPLLLALWLFDEGDPADSYDHRNW